MVWSKPEFDVCFDLSLFKRPAMADRNNVYGRREISGRKIDLNRDRTWQGLWHTVSAAL